MEKYILLGKKLKALADKGEDGERENAKNMLDNFMKKYDITIEDIEGDTVQDYLFNISDFHFQLWYQVVRGVDPSVKAYGPFTNKCKIKYGIRGNYMLTSTTATYVEIKSKYEFYKRLFDKEYKIFRTAFFMANDLLLDPANGERKQLTLKEIEYELRVREMTKGIKTGIYRKCLK